MLTISKHTQGKHSSRMRGKRIVIENCDFFNTKSESFVSFILFIIYSRRYHFGRSLTCTCSTFFLHEDDLAHWSPLFSAMLLLLPADSKSQHPSWGVVYIPSSITILDVIRDRFETFKLLKYSFLMLSALGKLSYILKVNLPSL